MRLVHCAAGVVAGALVGALVWHGRGAPAAPAAAASSDLATELAPDPAAVRYRYRVTARDDAALADAASTIAQLERRIAAEPSPFEMAELAERYFRRAQAGGDRGDYDRAEAMAERSLAVLRTPNPALLTLAKVKDARHDFRGAIALADEQLRYRRSNNAYVVLATAHLALGELPDASAAADAAVAMRPDTTAYLTRALVFEAQGRDPEAAFDFARAAAVEEDGDAPGAARLRALWGRFLIRRGDASGARLVLAEAVRVVPDDPLAVAQEGELALRTGHARDAVARFDQAFAASRQVRYLIDEARALELAGERANADLVREQVEGIVRGELGEGGLGHRLDLVEVLVDGGRDLPEAVALARLELARRGSFEARFQLARALARTGDLDGAEQQVQAALAIGTREAQLYELAARLERRRGSAARGAMYARAADRFDPWGAGWRAIGMEGL